MSHLVSQIVKIKFHFLILAFLTIGVPAISYALPDLIVQDITISPTSPCVGQTVTVTATLKNNSADATSIFVTIDMIYYLDGVQCDTGWVIAGLGAWATATDISTSCTPSTAGNHSISVFFDSNYDVAESNEGNNTRIESFTWYGPTISRSPTSMTFSAQTGQSAGSQTLRAYP